MRRTLLCLILFLTPSMAFAWSVSYTNPYVNITNTVGTYNVVISHSDNGCYNGTDFTGNTSIDLAMVQ